MKNNLLDYLYIHSHLCYLSELKNKGVMKRYIEFIRKIPEDDFSFYAWKEACDYLLVETTVRNSKEAKERLIQWIET